MNADSPQVPERAGAELRAELASGVHKAATHVLELDVKRVFVATQELLVAGSAVTLTIRLPGGTCVKAVARVLESSDEARAHRPSAGVELELIEVGGERATRQVAEYLEQGSVPPVPMASWLKGARVLVVDDDPHYRELAVSVMQEAGFDVITANNGFEALSMALKHQPSLVLSDVTMPGMDGWHFLRLIRARPALRRIPVVFLTELDSEAERLRGYQFGVDDYLAKPFSNLELIARVERVLERANMAEQAAAAGIRGDLSKVSLASLLSLSEMERRTGMLQLESEDDSASLHLRDGAVVRIDLPEPHDLLEGIERFFHVLDWASGRFELIATDVLAEDVIKLPTRYVLLEHARRQDEARKPP